MDRKNRPIGFFDSGVGGLSVLKEAMKLMPKEHYIYFGDSKNAPYGVREVEDVRNLTYKAVEFLMKKGTKAIVIACNTATSAAVAALRITYPGIPIVGIEPAVKPAVNLKKQGPIIIMATPVTLREKKFNNLMEKYRNQAEIIPMPCPGLMDFIESGKIKGKEVEEYIRHKYEDFNGNKIGAIVLGCTHYPFIKPVIEDILGRDIPIIDGGLGTSIELMRRLEIKGLINDSVMEGNVEIYNSLKEENILKISKKLLYGNDCR
ncbi:glutamate racemase [Clostridium vincentii]|uniref:Glutamate racemase n=1 Tax=Clostridium vincentii TaxID=52704 RepID=A0A2T0BHC8_9CLOT|nr:glutamate racemase [Clostridium vincentii]PRR83258.1 Glutamate racemase 2 [Clostridium vincentii]